MAKKESVIGNPEFEALKDLQGIDTGKLLLQAGEEPPAAGSDPPAGAGAPPPPPLPPPGDRVANPPPPPQDTFLKEIFGDRFKTVEEAKQANILNQLSEMDGLRQAKLDLEGRLSSKPKTNFANDEVALYNEFVRETGVKDYGVFAKINSADIANMDPMDAIVNRHILQNPNLIGKEPQVRKYFEKKYNVDPTLIDAEELEINKIGMTTDGDAAKKELQTVKEKLKIPQQDAAPDTPKALTPEEKTALQTGWNTVGAKVSETLAKLKIPIKGAKDPILSYALTEDELKDTRSFITDYAVQNRMELTADNVKLLSTMVYNQLMLNKLPDIVHSVFERARQMTEKEVNAIYTNPSAERNKDQPSTPPVKTSAEKQAEDIFDAEMNRGK